MKLKEALSRILGSEKYLDSRRRIDSWAERMRLGSKDDASSVLREKNAFFASVRKNSPRLYALFEADDHMLSRIGLQKTIGKDMIID